MRTIGHLPRSTGRIRQTPGPLTSEQAMPSRTSLATRSVLLLVAAALTAAAVRGARPAPAGAGRTPRPLRRPHGDGERPGPHLRSGGRAVRPPGRSRRRLERPGPRGPAQPLARSRPRHPRPVQRIPARAAGRQPDPVPVRRGGLEPARARRALHRAALRFPLLSGAGRDPERDRPERPRLRHQGGPAARRGGDPGPATRRRTSCSTRRRPG